MSKVDAQACMSLNVRNIFIQSKLHTYQNISTKKAHAGICYLRKKSSIKIHIPGQDGISESRQVPLPILSKTTHIMQKCHFNYEYITVEYR